VECIVLSANGDIEKQINDINDLIVEQVDIILVCSLDGEAVIPALAQAHGAGIPVLAVSNMPGKSGEQYLVGYSGPDDYVQGQIAAQIMVDAIGTSGNIIMIEGTAGQSTTLLRAQGWNDKMAEIAPNMKLLASQPCDWDGAKEKAAMQAFVTRYGSTINGVFSQGAGSSIAEAVRDAGLKAPVVCPGADQATLAAIREGYLYGTMQQSPYLDASQAIELALKTVKGDNLPAYRNIIPMPVVTAKNAMDVKADY
jgi:ribose transport system substrate-binding protein